MPSDPTEFYASNDNSDCGSSNRIEFSPVYHKAHYT